MRVAICSCDPSYPQSRAGHIFSGILIRETKDSREIAGLKRDLKPDEVMLEESQSPKFFGQIDADITASRKRLQPHPV